MFAGRLKRHDQPTTPQSEISAAGESLTSAISPNGLDQACIRPCTHKSNFVAAVGPCPLCLPEADIRQPH